MLFNSKLYTTTRTFSSISAKTKFLKNNKKSIDKLTRTTRRAADHFDGLYSRVFGRGWPSMRLALLSPKKQCAVMNSYIEGVTVETVDNGNVVDLRRYYKKHLHHYTRLKLREELIANKRARKREMIARAEDIDIENIDPASIEVSDISDSEIQGAQSTDAEEESFSSAEDLQEMFSDRRMDDDEKYFINQAKVDLSLDDFVPATELYFHEEVPDEMSYYEGYDQDSTLDIEERIEPALEIDERLKIFACPRGQWSTFKPPAADTKSNLLTHYMMDGASLLPVLALDLQFNDTCADYCAAPGGKSLAMLMTLKPKYLLSNDISSSRLGRMNSVMKLYLPPVSYIKSTLQLTNHDAMKLVQPDAFDKILVDVPCSNDRHSMVHIDNMFTRQKMNERLDLPNKQTNLLKSALKSLRPKGSLVYSTCTMSPIENDGVVQKALTALLEEGYNSSFAIMNLKEAFRPLRGLFKFHTNFKYGQQVVPNICSNFGPMYISKIKRIS